ncbi:MAG: exodeoxyribonuclease V subunit alpha [Parachlamydiaceae bacterium]|nr:exodeoxyribonuclease V subunit alpha [Parachlamydiaceae bacterium]
MLGLAQKKFMEQGGTLVPTSSRYVPHHPWPLIERMLANRQISYVDYALAEFLLRQHPEAQQDVAAFICHLSLASRQGHLCILVDDHCVLPDPRETWTEQGYGEETVPISDADVAELRALILSGAKKIPSKLVSEASLDTVTPICHRDNIFYFQRSWHYETLFLTHVTRIKNSKPAVAIDTEQLQTQLQEIPELQPEQRLGILKACESSLTMICGGPGTGKTYTAGQLIRVLLSSILPTKLARYEIALAAPTGKAAANLEQSLRRAFSGAAHQTEIKAKTLHALLGLRGAGFSKQFEKQFLSADLIVVDESSMIDVRVMAHLMESVKPGARLILLGDPHQLPPVSAGMLFADMVHLFPQHLVELKTCLRAELKGIVELAGKVNKGESQSVLNMLMDGSPGIGRVAQQPQLTTQKQQQLLIEQVLPHFDIPEEDPARILKAFNRFRLLSPMRKGPFGVDALNQQILHKQLQKAQNTVVLPIMLVSNDYRLELFNGEVGVLVRHLQRGKLSDVQTGDYALFIDRENADKMRKLPALLLPKYEYAYCLSVHKSQGSEFDHVLLLMPEGSELFGREVLYTAITRAKKQLDIWGSDSVLEKTMQRRAERLSGLRSF